MIVEVADLVRDAGLCQRVFVVLTHCHVRLDLSGPADANPVCTDDDSQPLPGRMRAFCWQPPRASGHD